MDSNNSFILKTRMICGKIGVRFATCLLPSYGTGGHFCFLKIYESGVLFCR